MLIVESNAITDYSVFLMQACYRRSVKYIKYFFEKGANPNKKHGFILYMTKEDVYRVKHNYFTAFEVASVDAINPS